MKSIITTIALFAMSFFAFTAASAQAANRVKVEIPFSFSVGAATVPAGTWYITANPSSPVVKLENNDGTMHFSAQARQDSIATERTGRLVFHRYGEHYFLAQVSQSGLFANLHFPQTNAEKRAKTRVEDAGLPIDDPIIVTLN